MRTRILYLLNKPDWSLFQGEFNEETVLAITGFQWRNYLTVSSMYLLANEHPSPREHFLVSPEQIRETEQHLWDKGRLVGIAHRHPPLEPEPSTDDYSGISRSLIGVVWCEGKVTWYDYRGSLEVVSLSK